MTKESYNEALKALEEKRKKELFELKKKYVIANKKFSVGDIIQDDFTKEDIIRIERIKIAHNHYKTGLPEALYFGMALTQKLEPVKRGNKEKSIFDERAHKFEIK